MSKAKEKPLPAYSHDSITQTDSAGNPTHITHYKEGKVIGHTYITYDATTGNIKNVWSDFRPRLRPMPVPVILLDKNMLIGNFPTDYPDASVLTELQEKLETADLSLEAVTKYLNVNVKTLPNVTLASQVNPFTSNLPIANPSNLDVALSTRALESGGNLASIKAKTDNIDTALSARTHTKHDAKTYKTAVFDASASGNLVAAVAGKVIKLHALTIQAQGTVVVNLNNGSGGASLMEWSFQAREGAVVPTANAPAYWAITSVNTALYVTLSAAVTVTITAIYSDDDAS